MNTTCIPSGNTADNDPASEENRGALMDRLAVLMQELEEAEAAQTDVYSKITSFYKDGKLVTNVNAKSGSWSVPKSKRVHQISVEDMHTLIIEKPLETRVSEITFTGGDGSTAFYSPFKKIQTWAQRTGACLFTKFYKIQTSVETQVSWFSSENELKNDGTDHIVKMGNIRALKTKKKNIYAVCEGYVYEETELELNPKDILENARMESHVQKNLESDAIDSVFSLDLYPNAEVTWLQDDVEIRAEKGVSKIRIKDSLFELFLLRNKFPGKITAKVAETVFESPTSPFESRDICEEVVDVGENKFINFSVLVKNEEERVFWRLDGDDTVRSV